MRSAGRYELIRALLIQLRRPLDGDQATAGIRLGADSLEKKGTIRRGTAVS